MANKPNLSHIPEGPLVPKSAVDAALTEELKRLHDERANLLSRTSKMSRWFSRHKPRFLK